MKYFTYKCKPGINGIHIFCEIEDDQHVDIAEKLGVLDEIISAGFMTFDEQGNVHCGGFSNSLSDKLGRNIASLGEKDERLFRFHNKMACKMEVSK